MSEIIAPATPPANRIATAPRTRRPATTVNAATDRRTPSILRVSITEQIPAAAALGFGYILLSNPDQITEVGNGPAVLLDIALDKPAADAAILQDHPEWFVHGADGPAFRYLSDSDETVDWWDTQIAQFQQSGVAGFYLRNAHLVAPSIWRRLLAAAAIRDPETIFIAEVFGARPSQLAELEGAPFTFCVSSACFWDYTQSWLTGDTARIARIAPAVTMATPPGTANWTEAALTRALRFSAVFSPGWLVDLDCFIGATFDHSEDVKALLALRAKHPALRTGTSAQTCSSPGSAITLLRRDEAFFIAVNASLDQTATQPAAAILPALGASRLLAIDAKTNPVTPSSTLSLAPAEIQFFQADATKPVFLPVAPKLDCNAPRIAIEAITPQVDDGSFPARRVVGDLVTIAADLIADGHDKLAGEVLLRADDEQDYRAYPLTLLNNDRWTAQIPLERVGRYVYAITAWKDTYATFVDEVEKKHKAGVPTQLELREGLALVAEAAQNDKKLRPVLEQLRKASEDEQRQVLLSPQMSAVMRIAAPRKFLARSHDIAIDAERLGASFASWYEIFPRSQSGDANRHGNFTDVIAQLPRIAAMGFDVLYFPPIHPIGEKNRKGKNNTLQAGPSDPGSPYAIGSAQGGHSAIHPQLGSLADFKNLIAAAKGFGIELALDFAIQCAPDHPWLREHKDWFDWRPDGSIRYAENPPKKYEDIVNVDFYTEGAKPALWIALRDAVQFWVDQGIKLFRVDNPHTKPFPFWEWLIADIRSRHPDTVFLAEAFTRPKIMYRLAKIGFSQSYTYFTWRNTKAELEEYLTELTTTAPREFFRPHFFVNTPDINPVFLQTSGRGGFLIRAALAATLSGLWGVYNGFELCEATPVPGKEDYLNSEKYEIKAWDYDRPGNIVAEISQLNRIRKANAALHSHLNIEFLPCNNPNVIYFRKFAPDGNVILAAISLDPFNVQDTTIELPLWRFGIADDGLLAAEDLMRDFSFTWRGKYQPVRLNPYDQPFCIWRIAPPAN